MLFRSVSGGAGTGSGIVMICPLGRAGALPEAAGALLLGGNSRAGCSMGLGLLVAGLGAWAIGGKLGLGVAVVVLMGGGGRGGKPGVAVAVGVGTGEVVGEVVGAGTGLGVAPASIWGCPGTGVNCGLAGAGAGAEAVCGELLGRSSILTIPAVIPTPATSIAAIFSHGNAFARERSRLRLGRAMTSAAQSSSAVAKSKSWRVLKCTSGPDSTALNEPKNKLWASKPRGSRRGGTGR